MFKKIAFAIVSLALAASAFAAPTLTKNATGTSVTGSEAVLSVKKDTSSGNRVKIMYLSGTEGYFADDAAWSRLANIVAGFGKAVTTGAPDAFTIDAAKAREVICPSGQTIITWSTVGQPQYISDACALFNAASGQAQ